MLLNLDIICGVSCWSVAIAFNYYCYYSKTDLIVTPVVFLGLPLLWLILFLLTLFPKRRPRIRLWWVLLSAPVALHIHAIMLFLRICWSIDEYHP